MQTCTSLAALPELLVQARKQRGWTQKQLASLIGNGLAEQQIQRYEATKYQHVALARLIEIANALGLTVTITGELRDLS